MNPRVLTYLWQTTLVLSLSSLAVEAPGQPFLIAVPPWQETVELPLGEPFHAFHGEVALCSPGGPRCFTPNPSFWTWGTDQLSSAESKTEYLLVAAHHERQHRYDFETPTLPPEITSVGSGISRRQEAAIHGDWGIEITGGEGESYLTIDLAGNLPLGGGHGSSASVEIDPPGIGGRVPGQECLVLAHGGSTPSEALLKVWLRTVEHGYELVAGSSSVKLEPVFLDGGPHTLRLTRWPCSEDHCQTHGDGFQFSVDGTLVGHVADVHPWWPPDDIRYHVGLMQASGSGATPSDCHLKLHVDALEVRAGALAAEWSLQSHEDFEDGEMSNWAVPSPNRTFIGPCAVGNGAGIHVEVDSSQTAGTYHAHVEGTVPADETVPVDAVPVDTVPVDAVPVDAVPVDAVPVDAVPVEAVPVEESEFRARFMIHPNGIQLPAGKQFKLFDVLGDPDDSTLFAVWLRSELDGYKIRAHVKQDPAAGPHEWTPAVPIADEATAIEVRYRPALGASAPSGFFELSVNQATSRVQALDNENRKVRVWGVGARGVKSEDEVYGTLCFDDVMVWTR